MLERQGSIARQTQASVYTTSDDPLCTCDCTFVAAEQLTTGTRKVDFAKHLHSLHKCHSLL